MAASHYSGLTAVADVIKDLDTQIAVSKLRPLWAELGECASGLDTTAMFTESTPGL